MPPGDGLVDIGLGVQVAGDPGIGSLLQQQIKANIKGQQPQSQLEQLRALRLSQQIEDAPLERSKLAAETAIKINQFQQLGRENALRQINLERARTSQISENFDALSTAFQTNFSQGRALLRSAFPGATATQNEDRSITVNIPDQQTGESNEVTFEPFKITDPIKRGQREDSLRKEFTKVSSSFEVQAEAFQKMKAASDLVSAQGDISIIFSFMKLLDPGSRITEGEIVLAKDAPGVPERIVNLYNRIVTSKAPLLGPAGSETRKGFLDVGEAFFNVGKNNIIGKAQAFRGIARNSGLDERNILLPQGGIDILGSINETEGQAEDEASLRQRLNNLSPEQLQKMVDRLDKGVR